MSQNFQEHINKDVKEDIKQLYRHADIANKEMGEIKADIKGIKTDLKWLIRIMWLIISTSMSGMIIGIINLIFK